VFKIIIILTKKYQRRIHCNIFWCVVISRLVIKHIVQYLEKTALEISNDLVLDISL
jgi:hypothetical protein